MYSTKKRLLSFTLVALMASSTGTVYADATTSIKPVNGVLAVEDTKAKVQALADQLLAREDLVRRFIGTAYMYPGAPGHDLAVTEEVIRDTPWYSTWKAASEAKLFLNSYDEKLAKNALNNLSYYDKLYAFPMTHHLKKDGFYKGNYKTYTMQFLGGNPAVQAFYKKKEENKDIRKLFSDVGVFKQGNKLEVNFALNKDEARSIEYVSIGHIATILPIAEIGPTNEAKTIFSVAIPGELSGDELVVTEMSYIDKNGVKKKTGTFGIDIDYSKLGFDKTYEIPGQKERVKKIVEIWINRGQLLLDEISESEHPTEAREIKEAVNKLEALKSKANLNQDEIYALVAPIYTSENEKTLRELISRKISTHLDIVKEGFYKEKVYTKESIKAYANFLNQANINNEYMSLRELVDLDEKLDRASSNTILRFNTAYLEKLLAIADSKQVSNYKEESLGAFYTAKSAAKGWVDLNKTSRPQLNETDDHINALIKAINELKRKDGTQEQPIKKDDLYNNKIELPQVEKVYSLNGEIKDFYDWNKDTPLAAMFETKMKLIEAANNKGKLQISLKPLKEQTGLATNVITRIEYNNNGRIGSAKVLKKEKVTVTNNMHQEVEVEYPSLVELNVDTSSEQPMPLTLILQNPFNNHTNPDVYLKVDYNNKQEESGSVDNDKIELQIKTITLQKELSDGYFKTFPSKQTEALRGLLQTAQTLLGNNQATSAEYIVARKNLEKEEEHLAKVGELLETHKALRDDCNEWNKSGKYTKASVDAIITSLTEMESGFANQVLSDELIETHTKKLQALRTQVIVNTEKLAQKITAARAKVQGSEGTDVQKAALNDAIANAEAYIKDITEKKSHIDRVSYYMEQLDSLMNALGEKEPPNLDPKPNPGTDPQPPNPGTDPQPPNPEQEKVYTVNIRFVQDNLTTPSHANGVLVTRAKLVTKGNKNTLFVKLQPLPGADGKPSGVVTDLSYYENNEKKPMTKLKESSVDISYEGRVETYTYPTEVSFPVDGHTKHVKCNTVSKSPATGQGAHDHDVILEIDYEHKTDGYSEQQVSKSDLITLLNTVKNDYYKSVKDSVPVLHWNKMEEAIRKAEAIVQKSDATEDDVNSAYHALGQRKEYVDFCIISQTRRANVEANLKEDLSSSKYSQESCDKAKRIVEEKNKAIGELLKDVDFSMVTGRQLLKELEDYYLELRYDVSALETLISQAKEKLNSQSYTAESLGKLREVTEEAEAYVLSAKATRLIADDRAKHQENITKAIENLVPKGGSEPGQTINTAALEQKISEAQARITNSNYTEASIQEVTKVINEAQAYIQGVKNGSEKTDKVQSYINKLNEKLAGLVENQVESVKGNLDASFTQPNGTPSMMERFFPSKKVDVTYLIKDNKTIYDFVLAPASSGMTNLAEETLSELSTAEDVSRKLATPSAEMATEATDVAEPMAVEEPASVQSTPEEVIPLALTPEDVKIWYVDNDGSEKAISSEAQADGKLKFHFEKAGKVDPNLKLKLLVKAMPGGQKVETRLNITVPENFYGALENQENQKIRDELKKEIAMVEELLSLEPRDKGSQYDSLKSSLETAKAKASQALGSEDKTVLESALKEIKEKQSAFTQGCPKVLEMKKAKEDLQKSVEVASSKKEADYEKDSFAPFAKALQKAKAVLSQAKIMQKDLEEAIFDLDKTSKALKTKGTSPSGGGGGGGGGGGSYIPPKTDKPDTTGKIGDKKDTTTNNTTKQGLKTVLKIGQKSYMVIKDGKKEERTLDVAPIVKNGKTMLPARMLGELLGVKVSFDGKTKTAKFVYMTEKETNTLELTLGKQMMKINGKDKALSTPVITEKGRILLPLRDIQVALKALGLETTLEWNQQTKEVTLTK